MIEAPQRPATAPDRDVSRRARLRAVASAVAADSRPLRRFEVGEADTLRRTARRRRGGPPPPKAGPQRHDRRRLLAALVLVAELGVLGLLLVAPVFRVSSVTVSGTRLLTPAEVLAAAEVGQPSVFTLDSAAVASRVRSLPWVESVGVNVSLPGGVAISVTERTPMVRVLRQDGEYAVAANGASVRLSPAEVSALSDVPILLDLRPAAMRTPVTAQLMEVLGAAATTFPSALGVRVVAYEWAASGQLSIWSSTGWQAILGDLVTPGEVAAVPGEVAALSALHADLDFTNPTHPGRGPSFGYVDLVDPAEPAVGGTPGLPAQVTAALSGTFPAGQGSTTAPGSAPTAPGSPHPAASTTPRPVASPTAAPTPTPTTAPAQLTLPPPSPAAH